MFAFKFEVRTKNVLVKTKTFNRQTVISINQLFKLLSSGMNTCLLVLRGTTVLPRHRGTIFLRYKYRRLYGTFQYRNATNTVVLRHGRPTCPLLTHSNEHLLDCIVFRLKVQHSACLLSFTAKLHTFYLFILCCFVVNQMSELTSDSLLVCI